MYTDTELQNIFTLYDLRGQSFITKDQCREGKPNAGTNRVILLAFSPENARELGVPLYKGLGCRDPDEGGHVHIHEDLRRRAGH